MTAGGDPAGLALRDMGADDVPEGLRLCRAAGWNQRAEDWQALLANGLFRVAEREGRVVGTGGAVVYRRRLAWVAMILVDPETRRQGIATRLMEDVLARVREVEVVGLDATPQGALVYAGLGFTDRGGLVRMERPAEAGALRADQDFGPLGADQGFGPLPADHGPGALRPLAAGDVERIASRDRTVFGADRSAVLRWAREQAPEYALGVDAGRGLAGYAFGRHGHRTEHLGPLVADDEETASRLLRGVLAASPGRAFTIDVPDRPEWLERLHVLGFRAQRPFRRMILGQAPTPGDPGPRFALFGPEFG